MFLGFLNNIYEKGDRWHYEAKKIFFETMTSFTQMMTSHINRMIKLYIKLEPFPIQSFMGTGQVFCKYSKITFTLNTRNIQAFRHR